jgi:hypothetical protein
LVEFCYPVADDADYSDESEIHQRNGFFGVSDRPAPVSQNQRNKNQQDYFNGYTPDSIANFLILLQPQLGNQQPVLIDEDFIYENASDEYMLYGIQE